MPLAAPPTRRTDLIRRLEIGHELARRASTKSLTGFLDHTVIDARPAPRPFRQIREPWQQAITDALAPAFEQACGLRHDYAGPRSFFITLPKGHDKTSLVARCVLWAVAFGRQQVKAVVAAADKGQANNVLERAQAEARLNPWLAERLKFIHYECSGPAGHLEVLSSDAPTSSGLLPDIVVVDELGVWPERGKALWDVLYAARVKRPDCVFVVITNAGVRETYQHHILTEAKADPAHWFVYEAPGKLASWLSDDEITAARRLLSPGWARRMYDNVWVDANEAGSYLTREQLAASNLVYPTTPGHESRLVPWCYQDRGVAGYRYVISVDYGAVVDPATLAVTHYDPLTDCVYLDRLEWHQGDKDNRTPLDLIDAWIKQARYDFPCKLLIADPNQLEGTLQKWEKQGLPVQRYAFQGSGHHKIAKNLRDLVLNHRLVLPNDPADEALLDELSSLVIIEQSGERYRVDHRPGQHDDRYTALALGALGCLQLPQLTPRPTPQVIPFSR